jgi:hypothetical protein
MTSNLTLDKPKPRAKQVHRVTETKNRRKKTVLLDGLTLDAVLHARAPKPPKRKAKALAQNVQVKPKATKLKSEPRVSNEFLGVFQSRSTIEDILVCRSWMHLRGLKPIDELFTITEFTSCLERLVRPRHAWTHFAENEEPRARRFLADMAKKLLPELLQASPGIAQNCEKPSRHVSEKSETSAISTGYIQ